jgi:formylglycine-generating enzyme required for sulfatase activity
MVVSLLLATGCPFSNDGPVPGETRIFDGIEFQWCPPGTFMMGSPESEVGRLVDETRHQVTISQGFWFGTYEVTQAQWAAVMGSNPSQFSGADRPVEQVSWEDVRFFITALNVGNGKRAIGGPYRLPTEAEWEYAYRAGTTTRFYWGEDPTETEIPDYAWYMSYAGNVTHNAGEKLPNAWGLYDMSGNVYEWCQDWYAEYLAGPVTDPGGPAAGTTIRVLRGAAWLNDPASCRAASHFNGSPGSRDHAVGFRLLRTPD